MPGCRFRSDLQQSKAQSITRLTGFLLLWLFLGAFPGASWGVAAPLTGPEIMDRLDDLYRSDSSQGRMMMSITTRQWQRTISLEFWSKGRDRMLLKVLSPAKERGIALLRRGSQVWNYLPKVNRLVSLPPSMLATSCFGSHFTYDDLVKMRRWSIDYECKITYVGGRAGEQVVEVTSIPKPGAPVVWGKVIVLASRPDYLPLSIRYYDEDIKLVRRMLFSRVKKMGGRLLPSRMTVVSQDKPGEQTVVVYQELSFDMPLDDRLFSPASLSK